MKRIILILMLLAPSTLSAQWSNTGSLTITGNMPVITQIQVNALAVVLDLSVDNTDIVVAELKERSNSASGYTVSVSSANSGSLIGTNLAESLAYVFKVGGVIYDLSSPAVLTDSLTRTTATGIARNIEVSTTSSALLLAQDSYTDILTLTVAPK